MNVLLIISAALPIVFSVLIRLLKIDGKRKEWLNLGLVILTSILALTAVILNPRESFYIFKFTEKLTIEFKLDGIGRIFAGMVAILWPFAYLYALGYMAHGDEKKNYSMFYVMTFGVVLGISYSANLLTLYFFYELLTLVTIPLIIHEMTKEAKRAARFYLYISLFGSTLALMGIVILISGFNVYEFKDIASINCDAYKFNGKESYAYFSYLLMFFGFGVKAAVFPLHMWLPQAGVAPTPTTALLHAVAVVKAGAFAIIRTIYSTIGIDVLQGSVAQIITVLVVSFTIVYGSSMAVKQIHFKRRFAMSTVSNISYILLAATMMSKPGLYAAILHLLFHSFAKIAIFFVAGELNHEAKVTYVDQVDGLGKKMPFTFACFTLAGLSIVGVPMFAGFISKFEIANAALLTNTWYGVVGIIALLISALLTAIYTISISIRAFFNKPSEYNLANYQKAHEGSYKFLVPIATFAIMSLLLGFCGSSVLDLISKILGGVL